MTDQTTRADREAAAHFYLKPEGVNGLTHDWIDGGDADVEVDPDVRDLAKLLAKVRRATAAERDRMAADYARLAGRAAEVMKERDEAEERASAFEKMRLSEICAGIELARMAMFDEANGQLQPMSALPPSVTDVFAAWFMGCLRSHGDRAPNFVEYRFDTRPEDADVGSVIVTVQRLAGQSPSQLKLKAEAEAESLRAERARLRSILYSVWRHWQELGDDGDVWGASDYDRISEEGAGWLEEEETKGLSAAPVVARRGECNCGADRHLSCTATFERSGLTWCCCSAGGPEAPDA